MKRSEVLGKIYDYLFYETDLDQQVLEKVANELLNICEESGMKPPLSKTCPVLLTKDHYWEE